ncbi:hypothetical protein [Metamycoplasma alkalescens]|nr:hypothetical protein [Metamycoplasma alkalescens]
MIFKYIANFFKKLFGNKLKTQTKENKYSTYWTKITISESICLRRNRHS